MKQKEIDEIILSLMQRRKFIIIQDITKELGICYQTAIIHLLKLENQGLVKSFITYKTEDKRYKIWISDKKLIADLSN